jgi:hypothetical protein
VSAVVGLASTVRTCKSHLRFACKSHIKSRNQPLILDLPAISHVSKCVRAMKYIECIFADAFSRNLRAQANALEFGVCDSQRTTRSRTYFLHQKPAVLLTAHAVIHFIVDYAVLVASANGFDCTVILLADSKRFNQAQSLATLKLHFLSLFYSFCAS